MALSRKMLEAMGIENEKIDQIIDMHMETVEGLKTERDQNQNAADELEETKKRLAEVESELERSQPYKAKFEDAQKRLDDLQASIASEKDRSNRESQYRNLLRESGIAEKRIDQVLKVSDLDVLEFDENGALKNGDEIKASIVKEWPEFIPTEGTRWAQVENPPTNNSSGMTKDQIMAIKNTVERQKAMAENIELFES